MSAQKLKSERNGDNGHCDVAVDQIPTERVVRIAHLASVERHEKQGAEQHSEPDGHEREERVTRTLNMGCRHGASLEQAVMMRPN